MYSMCLLLPLLDPMVVSRPGISFVPTGRPLIVCLSCPDELLLQRLTNVTILEKYGEGGAMLPRIISLTVSDFTRFDAHVITLCDVY